MHAVFMPYGKKMWVDVFLNDVRAQKWLIPFTSPDGKETKQIITDSSLRVLPFGVYEIAFPKEYMAQVLTTLNFPHAENHYSDRYEIPEFIMKQIRKVIHCEKAPTDFKWGDIFPWVKGISSDTPVVYVLPIGIRKDKIIADGKLNGWTHEAI